MASHKTVFTLALGSAIAASIGASSGIASPAPVAVTPGASTVCAEDNPFAFRSLNEGYMVVARNKVRHKARKPKLSDSNGEAKCGAEKKAELQDKLQEAKGNGKKPKK